MPDQVKPDQKIRLLPEVWSQIDEQTAIENRKSRANMVEVLIKRGLSHPDTLYFKKQQQKGESAGKFGNISFDPRIFDKSNL